MKLIKVYSVIVIALGSLWPVSAQDALLVSESIEMNHTTFLKRVFENNLEYAAEKFNIDIAEAELRAAAIFPDPELSFGWVDNQQNRMQMGYGFEAELSWDLELGGKRKARKDLARDEKGLADLELLNFYNTLRADATIAFLEGLQNKMLYDIQHDSYLSMNQVAQSDSIRFGLGQISKIDAVQSKLEAKSMYNELMDVEDTWVSSLLDLSNFSSDTKGIMIYPVGAFDSFDRIFNLEDLIITAQNNRVDFLVAQQNKIVADRKVRLAKAERVVDLGLSIGVENNSFVKNAIAPTPGNTAVKAGISVPLKFSNKRDSSLKVALYEEKQAQLSYQQVELELAKEIELAYRVYYTKQKQKNRFENGMLVEAREVFEGIRYSYQRGASSLLEVLEAQRSYNETQQAYAETLYDYAVALVELEKAVGIWDIDF